MRFFLYICGSDAYCSLIIHKRVTVFAGVCLFVW